jgi:hypothetical protein
MAASDADDPMIRSLLDDIRLIRTSLSGISVSQSVTNRETAYPMELQTLQALQAEVKALRAHTHQLVASYNEDRLICTQAMTYTSAKHVANAVLHALVDQCSAANTDALRLLKETGVIYTRGGLRHWHMDPRKVRNGTGSSLLHIAVSVSTATEEMKLSMVHFLVKEAEFNVDVKDLFGWVDSS